MEKRTKIFIYVGIVICCTAILVTAITVSLVKTSSSSYPMVSTECGDVEGRSFKEGEQDVYQFLNIPYAVPPTRHLRWRAPQPLKGSSCPNKTIYYNDEIIMCPQENTYPDNDENFNDTKRDDWKILGNEDCLILSVRTTSLSKDANLPVLVWIHGGGMVYDHSRSPGYHPDTEFTASMGLVTVSINYRLGIFGFLSLRDLWEEESGEYGNFAIMDQILALKWVQTNIRNFGGNPKDVTIFGNSGGGTAVYCLLTASLHQAQNLFHKAIVSSGAPNVHITKEEASKEYEARFLSNTRCANVHNKKTCLRKLSVHDVMTSLQINFTELITGDYEFSFPENSVNHGIPLQIIDTTVVKFSPTEILKQKFPLNYNMSILIGNGAQEPYRILAPKLKNWSSWKDLEAYLKPKVASFNNCSYVDLMELYRNKTSHKFTPSFVDPYYIYSLLTADMMLSCAATQLTYNLSEHPSFKSFSYILSQAFDPNGGIVYYPDHGSDIVALYDFKIITASHPQFVPSKSDLILKSKLREMVKNFIRSDPRFEKDHGNRTLEFWNATTQHTWDEHYHKRECDFIRQYGILKHSWGNRGKWNS